MTRLFRLENRSTSEIKQRASKVRKLLSIFFLGLSLLFVLYPKLFPSNLSSPFYLFVLCALLLAIIPLERLKYFKFKDIEASFEKEEVKAAITSLSLNKSENQRLVSWLRENDRQVDILYNARILWIDDHQDKLLLLRRLLRSFGVNVLVASSSSKALEMLEEDNDIDLIISDIQRKDFDARHKDAIEIHDGVNFIRYLRTEYNKDSILTNIPVLFYAAYDTKRLLEFIKPAENLGSITEATNEAEPVDFITRIIELLYIIRKSTPTKTEEYISKKRPTRVN